MSAVFGRHELPEQPGADPDDYLRLLSHRRRETRSVEQEHLRYTDLRWQIYSALVRDTEQEWTAAALASRVSAARQAETADLEPLAEAVSGMMPVLMADRWVEPVPFQRALTVRLTELGCTQLRWLLLSWSAQRHADIGDQDA